MSRSQVIILGILSFILMASLIGIGILAAKMVFQKEKPPGIVLPSVTSPAPLAPTSTLIPTPPLAAQPQPTLPGRQPSGRRIAVATDEGTGPFATVVLTAVPLHGGRRYVLEVTSRAGHIPFHGSWSESAISADGRPGVRVDLLKGTTPFSMDIIPPVDNPSHWSFSVSVQSEGQGGIKVTIWDVTGQ